MKYISLSFYIVASFAFLAAFPIKKENLLLRRCAITIYVMGHITLLSAVFREYDGRVWADSAGMLLALFIGLGSTWSILRWKLHSVGAFTAPLCTIILLTQQYFAHQSPINQPSHSLQNVLAGFHVLLAVIGEACIVAAAVLGVVYLRRRRQLKLKNFSEIHANRFSLESIEKYSHRICWAAFIFISLSLVSGALYTNLFVTELTWHIYLKIFWAFAVWVITLAMIIARQVFGVPFRKTAYLSLAALLLLATFFFGLLFSRPDGGF